MPVSALDLKASPRSPDSAHSRIMMSSLSCAYVCVCACVCVCLCVCVCVYKSEVLCGLAVCKRGYLYLSKSAGNHDELNSLVAREGTMLPQENRNNYAGNEKPLPTSIEEEELLCYRVYHAAPQTPKSN